MSQPDPRLAALSDAAIALALGLSCRPEDVGKVGRVSVLADELRRRGMFDALLDTLTPEMAASIRLLDSADRGQRWSRLGRR